MGLPRGNTLRELGRRLYFAVPPAARRLLLGPPRVAAQALRGLRVGVWRMAGPVGDDGVRLVVVYAGSTELRHYARYLIFPQGAEETPLGTRWVWTLRSWLRDQTDPPDLLVHQMRTWLHRMLRPSGLFYPLWIRGLVDSRRYGSHDSVVYDRKRIRRNGLSYRVSSSLEDFRHFYDELYLPFAQAAYGDTAEIRSFRKAIKKFRHWELVVVEKDGETVAGGQIVYMPSFPQIALTGAKEASREMVEAGVIAAIYYFMVEHLRERGHDVIDFGGVRPSLNDGLFRFKRQRGFRAHEYADNGYALVPLVRSEGLVRFLRRTPWVRVARGKLVGTVFVDGDASPEASPAELAHRYLVRGMDRLEVYRLGEGGAQGPAEVPPELANRLRILPAERVLGSTLRDRA